MWEVWEVCEVCGECVCVCGVVWCVSMSMRCVCVCGMVYEYEVC